MPGTPATDEQLLACHSRQMIDTLEAACSAKSAEQLPDPANIAELFGPEALCNEHTAVCARLAAGTAADVACRVARGETAAGVALVRPPGSQAGPTSSSGGSYYNNVAVAARAAQLQGAQRVLVLDFGLHHGAGTQAIFEPDASVLYISLHNASQDDAYPGGGDADEVGSDEGEGMTVNLAWKAGGVVDGDYLAAMQHVVLPIAYEFGPDLIIISGGFDATLPPIAGGCGVGAATYAHMVALTRAVAPVVLVLEDAGEVSPTAEAALACVRVLLGEAPPRLAPGGAATSETGRAAFLNALHIHSMYHKSVNPISLKGWLSVMQQQVAAQQTTEEEQGDDGADDVGNGSLQP